jgi:exopolyphosphatase/guanosine-5'-triphosphate,3'-diphosphate pyrophosphatase
MVRLGSPSLRAGYLSDQAIDRALASAAFLAEKARAIPGSSLRTVATSAIREARNGHVFVREACALDGLRVHVLTGEEEARLTLVGVRSELPLDVGRVAVLDIGGGTVDVAVGEGDGCLLTRSLPLGVLRLRDALVDADGVVREDAARVIAGGVRTLAAGVVEEVRALRPQTYALASGTSRALAVIAQSFPREGGPPGRFTRDAASALAQALVNRTPANLAALGAPPGREDTVATGAVVVATLMTLLGAEEARIASRGLREGVLAEAIAAAQRESAFVRTAMVAAPPPRDRSSTSTARS